MVTERAYLGVSIGSPYYSRERIAHYLSWARVNYASFAFLIGDEIAKYTLAGLKHLTLSEAYSRSMAIGDNACTMLQDVCQNAPLKVEVYRWGQLSAMEEYAYLLEAVEKEHRHNSEFRLAVRSQVWMNLGSRICELGVSEDAEETNDAAAYFDRYIIEEIAGLITMSEFTPYSIEVYPGGDLDILKYIYNDRFATIGQAMPKNRKRKFKNIKIL